jgi:hypothetical protein
MYDQFVPEVSERSKKDLKVFAIIGAIVAESILNIFILLKPWR